MRTTIVLALTALLVAGSFPALTAAPAPMPSTPSPEPGADTLESPTDLAGLRAQYQALGILTLPVPLLGALRVTGEANHLTSHGDRTGEVPYLQVLGHVLDHPGSTANILLGEHGVYGAATVPVAGAPPLEFRFDVAQGPDGGLQRARLLSGPVPPEVAAALPRPYTGFTMAPPADGEMPASSPPSPFQGNETGTRSAMVDLLDGLPGPLSAAPMAAADAASTTYYFDDDGTMEATIQMDYTDDDARKTIWLPDHALDGVQRVVLSLDGQADSCSGAAASVFSLDFNGYVQHFDPCDHGVWGGGFHKRWNVEVPRTWALAGDNSIRVRDSSHWTTRNAYFGIDQGNDNGRSYIHQCQAGNCPPGDNIGGELMWSMVVTTAAPPPTPSPGPGCQPPASGPIKVWNSGYAQGESSARSAQQAPDPCDNDPDCSGGQGVSWVTFHAENGLIARHPDWMDRILSSVAHYTPMWNGVCIILRAYPVSAQGDILTNDSCSTGQYEAWLAGVWRHSTRYYNDDAYQLWTHRDLALAGADWPETAYCYGSGVVDAVDIGRVGQTPNAASVIEGHDFTYDTYDADDAAERGIVSGHEMAHVYGEENHPYHCWNPNWYGDTDCNIMRNCKPPMFRSFRFKAETKHEIMFRYHYAEEVNGGHDGEDGCPS